MIIYLMRHAESETNPYDAEIISGVNLTTPLSEPGRASVYTIAKQLSAQKKLYSVDAIYTSPAKRAQETLQILQTSKKISNIKVVVDPSLLELSQGVAEGRPRPEMNTLAIIKKQKKLGKNFSYAQGESINQAAKRMHKWITSISLSHEKNATILVISHAMLIRSYVSYLNKWSTDETIQSSLDNCHVVTLSSQRNFLRDAISVIGFNESLFEAWERHMDIAE